MTKYVSVRYPSGTNWNSDHLYYAAWQLGTIPGIFNFGELWPQVSGLPDPASVPEGTVMDSAVPPDYTIWNKMVLPGYSVYNDPNLNSLPVEVLKKAEIAVAAGVPVPDVRTAVLIGEDPTKAIIAGTGTGTGGETDSTKAIIAAVILVIIILFLGSRGGK